MSINTFTSVDDKIWFYLFVMAILEGLAVYLWQFRKMPGAMVQVYSQACKGAWLLFLVFASMSTELSSKLFWLSLQQMSAILLCYLWFMFIIQISQLESRISPIVHYILRGILISLWLIILSNGWHGWYWQDVWMDGKNLIGVRGPASNLVLGFSYLLNLISFGLGVRWMFSTAGLRRRQAIAVAVSPVFGWGGHILGKVIPATYAFSSPLGFLLGGVYITWAYRRWLIFSILPQAQDAVVRLMVDGLLVIDEQDYIVDMNPAAKMVFNGLPVVVGSKFQDVINLWPALAELELGLETVEATSWQCPEGGRYYQVNMTPLHNDNGYLLGKIMMLKDITKQKQDQNKKLEQQKVVSILAERNRLGRELHDGQGQIWNYLQLELQTVRVLLNTGQLEETGKQVDRLIEIARNLNTDVRESITNLKSTGFSSGEFVTILKEYLDWYEKTHSIATRLILPEGPVANIFSSSSEVQLLRIIQEALTNIRKHAKAQQVEVAIQQLDGQRTVLVVDDGCGFNMAAVPEGKKSYGLQIMRERAEEAGGHLYIESRLGVGTKVMVKF